MRSLLTPHERETICAALDRVVPPEGNADVRGRDCIAFVEDLMREDPHLVMVYQAGAAMLESQAGGAGFAALEPDAQDDLMLELEALPFLQTLIRHGIEGCYTSRDGVAACPAAWEMIGFKVTG